MKQVQEIFGRLVQLITPKSGKSPVRAELPPTELDAKSLDLASGGTGESTQTPRVGW